MNTCDPSPSVPSELNDLYARHGRYLAAWLSLFPEDHVLSPPEPDELVQRYHALREENKLLLALQAQRQALIERDAVQAALWISRWPLLQWPPVHRVLRWFARHGRVLFRKRPSAKALGM